MANQFAECAEQEPHFVMHPSMCMYVNVYNSRLLSMNSLRITIQSDLSPLSLVVHPFATPANKGEVTSKTQPVNK